MRAIARAQAGGPYVLTEKGKFDLLTADECHCNPRLSGLLLTCPDCGTIYGSLRDSSAWGGRTSGEKRR